MAKLIAFVAAILFLTVSLVTAPGAAGA